MTARPASLGNPRSMIATSSGYSRPANRPSSPSCATSTVKPASISRVLSVSRNAASSSTTSARMPLASADPDLQNHAARRIDTHRPDASGIVERSEEHTSELQSRLHLVCRLLLEKKKTTNSLSLPFQTYMRDDIQNQ